MKNCKIDIKEVSGCSSEMFKKNKTLKKKSQPKNFIEIQQQYQNKKNSPKKKHFYNGMSKIERIQVMRLKND